MPERRFRGRARVAARIPCRVCFRAVDVHPDFMERAEVGWVLRCPQCRHTFPVRAEDSAAALARRAGVPAHAVAGAGSTGGATGAMRGRSSAVQSPSSPSPSSGDAIAVAGVAATSLPTPVPGAARVRVLVVDDEPDVRLLLHAVLASPDVEVVGEAGDGFDALEIARSTDPDVIVLDLMLPTLSGLDVLRALRRDRPDVRVVAVSAMPEDAAERDALAAGADVFVSKLDLTGRLLGAVTGR